MRPNFLNMKTRTFSLRFFFLALFSLLQLLQIYRKKNSCFLSLIYTLTINIEKKIFLGHRCDVIFSTLKPGSSSFFFSSSSLYFVLRLLLQDIWQNVFFFSFLDTHYKYRKKYILGHQMRRNFLNIKTRKFFLFFFFFFSFLSRS